MTFAQIADMRVPGIIIDRCEPDPAPSPFDVLPLWARVMSLRLWFVLLRLDL